MYGRLFQAEKIHQLCQEIRQPLHLIQDNQAFSIGVLEDGLLQDISHQYRGKFKPIGTLPPLYPERLGSSHFLAAHGARFPYVVGAMANGITTAEMVIAASRAGCMAFFGAAGLAAEKVLDNIVYIQSQMPILCIMRARDFIRINREKFAA
jgi:trans-AT polyketide synthase, acyltransferase and oxidoreductase domains